MLNKSKQAHGSQVLIRKWQ